MVDGSAARRFEALLERRWRARRPLLAGGLGTGAWRGGSCRPVFEDALGRRLVEAEVGLGFGRVKEIFWHPGGARHLAAVFVFLVTVGLSFALLFLL